MLSVNNAVRERYPGVKFGIMAMDLVCIQDSSGLRKAKTELESHTRHNFSGLDKKKLRTMPPFSDYHDYYKQFKKTYHVLHQCESIASGKRTLPNGTPLVQAMFMAEIKNQLLTAGYDIGNLDQEFKVQLADGELSFNGMGMRKCTPPRYDILFTCNQTSLGSIICGPDHDHRIQPETKDVLFAIYGVPGITAKQMEKHFEDIREFVYLIAPEAITLNVVIQ